MFDKEKLKQAMNDHGDTNKALAVFLGMTASISRRFGTGGSHSSAST